MEEEKIKLKHTIDCFLEVIDDLQLTITSLNNNYNMDADFQYVLVKKYENKLRIISQSINKPYFARIDFTDNTTNHQDICYISKVGVSDFDNNLITVDWRSPIASLYYDSNLGPASYKAPGGIITGNLSLKRQYDIEEGTLLSYREVDTVSNDDLLKPYLDVNADNRLKNIVSSIQKEQNQVIRKDLIDNTIIQGVAGSGKTTVALHRIAYLAYNYKDTINSNQYLVIGPNKFFINYISSILPDLDVTDVDELTYEEFVKTVLLENFKITDLGKLGKNINISQYKTSLKYKEAIDKFVLYIDKHKILPEKDFIIKNYVILKQSFIKNIYNEIEDKYFTNIESKVERSILLISNYIKNNKDSILSRITLEYQDKFDKATLNEQKNLLKEYNILRKEILSTNCINSLRKYFNFKSRKITNLYDEFLNNIDSYIDIKLSHEFEILKNKIYTPEDLPALLYLASKVKNTKEYSRYRHTVVDEAQDYGQFHFLALKEILCTSSFSIFGDLAQSINDYRSINNWEEVCKYCFNNNCSLEYLQKSYRTTIEIMNCANLILDHINLTKALPVIRHGKNVQITKVTDNYFKQLLQIINSLQNNNYDSIAIISRTNEKAHLVYQELTKLNIKITEITPDKEIYDCQLCSVSTALAKGLEFDAVIIADANEEDYSSTNKTDMKNLYVAMTRPLHELVILYQNTLTYPLSYSYQKFS